MADENGTVTETQAQDPGQQAEVQADVSRADATEQAAVTEAVQQAEAFFDPASIPAELQPTFKRMQASFTKKMQALSSDKAKLRAETENYQRLLNDPEYARQVILEAAPRLGLTVGKAGIGTPSNGNGNTNGGAPAEVVAAAEARLPAELKWMAQGIADAQWAAHTVATRPMLERQNSEIRARREQDYERLAEDLSGRIPDWQAHEDEMMEVLQFVASEKLTHPVYGSKLDLLYNIVTKNTAATQEAIRRMSNAGRQRTTTGRVETQTQTNLPEIVRKAPTMQDAWDAAAKAALEQVGKR